MEVKAIWKASKESHHYASEKIIPSRRKKKKIWISNIDKRRLLKEKKEGTKPERLIGKYAPESAEQVTTDLLLIIDCLTTDVRGNC